MTLSRALRRVVSFFRADLARVPSATGSPVAQSQIIDEEACPSYNSGSYYPAKPGEVVANYQVLVKIGWGTRSTVWLARDIRRYKWQSERFVALKINNISSRQAHFERDIENHIANANISHRGHVIIRACVDSFEVAGPEGKHLCLAYEPMREPLWLYQTRYPDRKLPVSIAKAYFSMILTGLDYLHSDCKVVHTDLKLENILVSFEEESVIGDFAKAQSSQPMEYKIDPTGRIVYRCHNNFGPLRRLMNLPKIVDFGMARHLRAIDDAPTTPIQPDHYRAPEVIFGCNWSFSADIWNLGLLVWDVFERKELFQRVQDDQGRYSAKSHLAEMMALLGPPPKSVVERFNKASESGFPGPIRDDWGRPCNNARELFKGPFFSEDGEFLYKNLIPDRRIEDTVLSLEGGDKELLLSFAALSALPVIVAGNYTTYGPMSSHLAPTAASGQGSATKPKPAPEFHRPIAILSNTTAQAYSHVHPLLIASIFAFSFGALVSDPVSTLSALLPVFAVLQVLYVTICLPAAGAALGGSNKARPSGKIGTGLKRKDAEQSIGSKLVPAILSLSLPLVLGTPALTILLVLFGAPLTTHLPQTVLCAAHMSILAGTGLVYAHGTDESAWREIWSISKALDTVWGATIGMALGAWLGAVPIPLDWDRPWQTYPITIITGACIGYVLGSWVGRIPFVYGSRIQFVSEEFAEETKPEKSS